MGYAMTSTESVPAPGKAPAAAPPTATAPISQHGRALFRAAALLTVLPIVVAAVRHGLNGWIPVGDAATTAVRANDVFSRHFPLVGMWSSASSWAGRPINFPGALQLYVMAVPMRLLGNTWGVLVGIATINTAALLTSCWLIRRRVGYRSATVACVFIASFVWTLGSEVLVDMTPMQMVTVPCMLLFVAVWSVGDGDTAALPVLAFVANYLLLDHLTLSALVPTMIVVAAALLAMHLRRQRADNPELWPDVRLQTIRATGWALLITLLAWTPPLIQQFTGSPPHNLTNLYEASKVTPPHVVKWGQAVSALGAVIAAPPWWLRPTFRTATFRTDGTGRPAVLVSMCAAALLTAYFVAFRAARRRDRTVATGLLAAAGSVVGVLLTLKKSTNPIGLLPGYLHSLWVSAVFVWMLLGVAAVRLLPAPQLRIGRRTFQAGAVAMTAVMCVLSFPASNQGSGTWPWAVGPSKQINAQAIPQLRGKGTVLVTTGISLEEGAIQSSLLLAMQADGIPFVLTGLLNRHQFGEHREFVADPPNAQIAVYVTNSTTAPPGTRRIAQASSEPTMSDAAFQAADRHVRSWLASLDAPQPNPVLRSIDPRLYATVQDRLDNAAAQARTTGKSLADVDGFISVALGTPIGDFNGSWLNSTGISEQLLQAWAEYLYFAQRRQFFVYMGPVTQPTAS